MRKAEQVKEFKSELAALCRKHGMVVVPQTEGKPSAHDSMLIVPFDEFWGQYIMDSYFYSEDPNA